LQTRAPKVCTIKETTLDPRRSGNEKNPKNKIYQLKRPFGLQHYNKQIIKTENKSAVGLRFPTSEKLPVFPGLMPYYTVFKKRAPFLFLRLLCLLLTDLKNIWQYCSKGNVQQNTRFKFYIDA